MSKDMIGSITRALVGVPLHRQGTLLDVVQRLSNTSSDGDGWRSRFAAVISEGLPQKKEEKEIATSVVLELVGTVVAPATTSKFVASKKFVLDTSRKAKVRISYLGDNFTAWFLSGNGKVEDLISEQTLRCHKLRKFSIDGPIITELGGEAKAETTLSEMFSLMEKQKNGESGVLLNNGYANIFYVRDIAGALRAVCVGWNDGGWNVHARSVESPHVWHGGFQVFSRNS
jgi:hypothetical protein